MGERCPICGKPVTEFKGVNICLSCNDRYGEFYNFFANAVREFKKDDGREQVMIACPGVTIYDESNSRVVKGVRWNDPQDFSKGYEIVGKQMFAPGHQLKRLIPKEKANNICRCQACQDFTIRLRTFNNQKKREVYMQDSPMMPRLDPGEDFTLMADLS